MRYLGLKKKVTISVMPESLQERAEAYNDDTYQLRGSKFFSDGDGLTTRRFNKLSRTFLDDPSRLVVDRFVIGTNVSDNLAVTTDTLDSDEWKNIVREWEGFGDDYLLVADETSGPFPPLAHFSWTSIRGRCRKMNDEAEVMWLAVFYEKYIMMLPPTW